ncbi:MAG: hypothetical protein KTR32_13215 [Granulosicoccus sp.]|nr:hypothetical protein [Granulosicoccus sp.]
MSPFIVNPHGRLQEWIADEKGYFTKMGLQNYTLDAHQLLTKDAPKLTDGIKQVDDKKSGAYQTYEEGRDASISCACHWTVNMAASDSHGRLWGECYSVSPCAIVVPEDSSIKQPQDLAGVDVHVGYQSGSHYTTIQALEPFLETEEIKLKFGGTPADRVDQLLAGLAPAATVFGPQLYVVEQLGFRKIIDCTFMIAAIVPDGVDSDQVSQYYDALRLAQSDIDCMHQPYVHYYLNELPERHAKLVDVKRFGPGERLVFEPYTEGMYDTTQAWIRERGIFDGGSHQKGDYKDAVVRL